MKKMFEEAEINVTDRRITNHSARITQVTTLLNKGHDNYDIKQRSGHRSDAVDRYKHPSNKRKFEMSAKLDVTSSVKKTKKDVVTGDALQPPVTRRRSHEKIKAKEELAAQPAKMRIEIPLCVKTLELVYDGKVSVVTLSRDN